MIIATVCVRNEEDIIESFLEHHLPLVDKIILTDNGSTDKTLKIAQNYDIEIISQPIHDFRHGEWVTNMARMAYKMGATWVANMDADEFWYNIDEVYSAVNSISVFKLQPNYDYLPLKDAKRQKFSFGQMPFWTRSPAGLRIIHRAMPDVIVTDGNHEVKNCPGGRVYAKNIYVKHFSIRSYEQFQAKVIKGGTALEKSPQHEGQSTHWRAWYKAYKKGKLRSVYDNMAISPENLPELMSKNKIKAMMLL